jgi:hypothetical protein
MRSRAACLLGKRMQDMNAHVKCSAGVSAFGISHGMLCCSFRTGMRCITLRRTCVPVVHKADALDGPKLLKLTTHCMCNAMCIAVCKCTVRHVPC